MTPKGSFLAPEERNVLDLRVMAENIALRWSASDTVNNGAINIWLLWSQDFVCGPSRLRHSPIRRDSQGVRQAPPGQFNFELVLALRPGIAQRCLGRLAKARIVRWLAG